jgi:hypothetical protein
MSERIANANYRDAADSRQDGPWNILWDELKPFPDRARTALRLALTCTAIVLVSNTFRLPLQDVLPFLVLFASKEEKVSTAITALLALVAITLAVGASILIFKCTGDRAEFRIPAMAMEIFVGMYLFRILVVGPVGFILAFIVSVSQSVVDLFPTPEEAVHQFLWVWAAVALSITFAWVANLLLFPVAANQVLQRELVAGWGAVVAAATELTTGSSSAAKRLLRPLAKRGPIRLLKLLKLSLIEAPGLRLKQARLMRFILSLDKIAKLLFSYTNTLLGSPGPVSISSAEKMILGQVAESAEHIEQEFAAGFVPSGVTILAAVRDGRALPSMRGVGDGHAPPGFQSVKLAEAQSTLEDLAANETQDQEPKPAARQKKTLFVRRCFYQSEARTIRAEGHAGRNGWLFLLHGERLLWHPHGLLHSADYRARQYRGHCSQGGAPNCWLHYRRCFGSDLFGLADPEIRDIGSVPPDCILPPRFGCMGCCRQRPARTGGGSSASAQKGRLIAPAYGTLSLP